jgi:hypothetical protein
MVKWDRVPTPLKVNFRLYTYADTVLFEAARLYRGQTTNMRTPGGGLRPCLSRYPRRNLKLCANKVCRPSASLVGNQGKQPRSSAAEPIEYQPGRCKTKWATIGVAIVALWTRKSIR